MISSGSGARPVSALTINDNVIFVNILPADRAGERAFVDINAFPRVLPHRQPRDDHAIWAPDPRKIYINREPGSNQLTLWGNIPVDDQGANEACPSKTRPTSPPSSSANAAGEARRDHLWRDPKTHHTELASLSTFSITTTASAGGGSDRLPHSGIAPSPGAGRLRLAAALRRPAGHQQGQPEPACRAAAAASGKEKGTAGRSKAASKWSAASSRRSDLRPEEYIFYDGSGLSRQDLVTPHAIVKLLTYAHHQPWGASYADTLSRLPASMARWWTASLRRPRRDASKRKTGSLDHVNALSGYLTTAKGEHLAFSILSNNHNLTNKRAIETIDSIVQTIVDEQKK